MIRLLKEEIRSVGSIKEAVKTMSGKIENGVHDYKTHFLETNETILRYHLVILLALISLYSMYHFVIYNPNDSQISRFIFVILLVISSVMMQTAFIFSKIRNY